MAYQNIYIDQQAEPATVYVWDDNKGLVTLPLSDFNYAYVKDPKGQFLSMTGDRLSRTRRFTRNNPNIFESDLPRETRVLTDLYLNEDLPSEGNIVMFFDIEVSMANGIPDIHKPNNEITSIAYYDAITSEYNVLVLDKTGTYESQNKNGASISFYQNEVDLLHAFIREYETIQPTIITGWNSNGFDVPYLYNRLRQVCGNGIANRLSPIGKVKYSERLERYRIAGVSSLDYLDLYKKYTYTQLPNYRLDTVANVELGRGKVVYEGSLDDLFRNDLNKFIDYNLEDVKLLVDMDIKLRLIDLVRGICHVGHVPYEDYPMASRVLEGTIVTYLHRKNIIVTDKPQDTKEKMEALDNGEEGFTGAFVKVPMPGMYDWVYSLDLQSLYPSIIMSLNISPETKVGFVRNWDIVKHNNREIVAYVVEETGNNTTMEMDYDSFVSFMQENNLTVSSNGVLYTNDKKGIIPEVLENWFAQRVEYKNLMKKYTNEGDKVKAAYYDQRQHIQKIFLNSLYGVLGLPVFRFYDVDNAAAVTLTGQDIIKNSASFVNNLYASRNIEPKTKGYLDKYWGILKDDAKKRKVAVPEYPSENDHCVYIDTDSLYFSADVFVQKFNTTEEKQEFTIKLARAIESKLNKYYDAMARDSFFCTHHKFFIKGESVAKTGIWTGKKRYALDKVYDLETNQSVSKTVFKGLDVVRSTFPKAFGEFMKPLIKDILHGTPKEEIDARILEFKSSLVDRHFMDIARNTSANGISEYTDKGSSMNQFQKGTPAHIKAAIIYNRLLKHFDIESQYEIIADGAKIKYVYLKENPLQIDAIAVKGYNDPQQILELIEKYLDTDALFENELRNKLDDFYWALNWGNIPTEVNQNANEFFAF